MYTLGEQAEKRLQDILMRAVHETEYYREIFSAHKEQMKNLKLSDFPLLTRQDVQRERSHFLCDKYQRYPDIDYLLMKRSFGISGEPLEVYWDSRDEKRSEAFLWEYRKRRFNITAEDKCCIFRTAEYAGNKIMDIMPKRLSRDRKVLSFSMHDLSPERLQWCWEMILEFHPLWMSLPPSIARMLAENITENHQPLPSSLRYMELYGESFDTDEEAAIRDTFHVQTGSIYATQASGVIAASCEHGHLHIFPENVIVEVIRDGKPVMDEEGDIYITSIQNTAMPLVRLKTGDQGILQSSPCSCGQPSPVLRLTRKRKCDFITTAFGRKLSAFVLRSLAEYTNEEVSRCLAHIRFKQNDCDRMDVIMRMKPAFAGWGQETARVFQEKVKDSELNQMQWNFSYENLREKYESKLSYLPLWQVQDLPCRGKDETQMEEHLFFEPWEGEGQ